MQFSSLSCFLLPLRQKCRSEQPIVWNTLGPYSSLSMRGQVSHLYTTTDKVIALYISILMFWIANWKIKDSGPHENKHSLSCLLLTPSWMHFWLLGFSPNIGNFPHFWRICYPPSCFNIVLHTVHGILSQNLHLDQSPYWRLIIFLYFSFVVYILSPNKLLPSE